MTIQQLKTLIFLMLTIFLGSCTVPKEGRQLKHITKKWDKSPLVLRGYNDSPLGGSSLTLRGDKKFELTSSGFFMNWYEAGNWTIQQDTIKLFFMNSQLRTTKTQNVFLNRQHSTLNFIKGDSVELTLRVIYNQLPN